MCQRSEPNPTKPLQAPQGRSASEKAYRRHRAWLPGINPCGAAATRVALAVLLAVPIVATAQPDPTPAQPIPGQSDNPLADLLGARQPVRLPTPDEAMAACNTLEAWIRAWADPLQGRQADLPAPDRVGPEAPTAAGVRVSLYQAGRLVGWGAALAETPVEPRAADRADPLAVAAADAMAQAARALVPRADALAPEQLRLLAADLTISLELAGPLTPLSETELANPDAALRPGLDGMAVRVNREWLVAYPSEILAAATPAGVRLPAMAAKLLRDPALGIELPIDLVKQHGVAFYRFEVVHIVSLDRTPRFLHRGGAVVESREVTTDSIVRFAESLLAHAEAGLIADPPHLGLMGPLDAPRGAPDPHIATPTQQSLMALALLRLADTPKLSGETHQRARTLAREIMLALAVTEPAEIAPEDDGVAAAIAWVVLDTLDAESDESLGPLLAGCESMLARHTAAERPETASSVSNAILVWALAERAARTGADREVAERDLRALYRATPPGNLVGLMPWLGWAELRLAGAAPVPAHAALRQVRDLVWEHQLRAQDTGYAERDLAGGIVFTRGAVALPTWSTARPTALCATMLGDPRLTTPAETPAEVVRLIASMRFLRQLSARGLECAFYPRADLAAGGVRAALWDPRMPPEATAMTMLAVAEFLRSLDALESRQNPAFAPESR